VYSPTSFFPPVAAPPAINRIQRGRVVPVKFDLKCGRSAGLDILKPGFPRFRTIFCDTLSPVDALADFAAATPGNGNTGLRYDGESRHYIFNWDTPSSSAYSGACVELRFVFDDDAATTIRALFRMR
jgi:hypothetical protein